MNTSLLAKWRWKLLVEGDEMWKKVVKAKYGNEVVGNASLNIANFRNSASGWWRDICRIDDGVGWFRQVAVRKVGNGGTTRFWKDVWVTNQSLESLFPRLFGISVQQEALVSDMGSWENGVWSWEFLWRRQFFVWEEALVQQLLTTIELKHLSTNDDSWEWTPAIDEGFSVKSLYVYLDNTLSTYVQRNAMETFAFRYIWKSGAPSKVSALAWQVLLDRVPTKDNLHYRGILSQEEIVCSVCADKIETASHLFLHCDFAANVWYALNRWLGVIIILPPNLVMSYSCFVACGNNRKYRKGFSLVWLAFVWGMWRMRNDRIFNNKVTTTEEVVDYIQRISWQWYLNNVAKGSSLLYEWVWNPRDCMLR
jgi:hypothetical protein